VESTDCDIGEQGEEADALFPASPLQRAQVYEVACAGAGLLGGGERSFDSSLVELKREVLIAQQGAVNRSGCEFIADKCVSKIYRLLLRLIQSIGVKIRRVEDREEHSRG